MPGKRPMRWGENDAEKFLNLVKRFNAKVYRVDKNHPEMADIQPGKINKAQREQMITEFKELPRSEFNKTLHSLERYLQKGAEGEKVSATGNRVSKWEYRETALKVAQVNRERTRERKKAAAMDATSRGESLGLKRGEMGSERMNALQPKKFDFNKIKPGKEWELFKATVDKQSSPTERDRLMEQYKENYLKGLDEFGGYADDIKAIIKQLPADVVTEVYYKEQEATIRFYYEAVKGLQDRDTVIEIIHDIWQNALDEYNALHR